MKGLYLREFKVRSTMLGTPEETKFPMIASSVEIAAEAGCAMNASIGGIGLYSARADAGRLRFSGRNLKQRMSACYGWEIGALAT